MLPYADKLAGRALLVSVIKCLFESVCLNVWGIWWGQVTEDDIMTFQNHYRGGEEEADDLRGLYERFQGDMGVYVHSHPFTAPPVLSPFHSSLLPCVSQVHAACSMVARTQRPASLSQSERNGPRRGSSRSHSLSCWLSRGCVRRSVSWSSSYARTRRVMRTGSPISWTRIFPPVDSSASKSSPHGLPPCAASRHPQTHLHPCANRRRATPVAWCVLLRPRPPCVLLRRTRRWRPRDHHGRLVGAMMCGGGPPVRE